MASRICLLLPFVFLGSFLAGCGEDPDLEKLDELASYSENVNAYRQVCATCHGENGEGKEEVFSPSIAGLPAWYIEEQVNKFREGTRGFHPEDVPGQMMRGIALTLTDEQVKEAAQIVSQMDKILTEPPAEGVDLLPGRRLYARECMACHRYNGTGEATFHSAQLIALNRSYIRRQLLHYREGKRGATKDDIYGNKMVQVTSRLSDEDIEALVDYIGALAHGDDPRSEMER